MENARSRIERCYPAASRLRKSPVRPGRAGQAAKTTPRFDALIVAICVTLLAVYLAIGAKALNLDGLGYAERVESGDALQLLLPGHLLYGPLMHALYHLANVFYPGVDAARLMQTSDAAFAAIGVGVFIAALRRLGVGRFTAVAAGLALAFTYTYWTHATDLTTYALSTLCLVWTFYCLCAAHARAKLPKALVVGSLVALATLIHQSNLVFLPAAMVGVSRTAGAWRSAVGIAAVTLALVLVAYAALGWTATASLSPSAIAKWAAGGAHGYALRFEPVNLARGVYGFANAIIYLDDVGTAIKGRTAGVAGSELPRMALARFAGKVAVLGLMLAIPFAACARKRSFTPDQAWAARLCVVWIVCYALVALVFFTTDHDRWIMPMPAVAALAAVAHPKLTSKGRLAAVWIVAALFGLNLSSAVYLAHTGAGNRYYQEARCLAPRLYPSDLVLFWGHYHVGTAGYLRRMRRVEAVHIVDLVLKNGRREGLNVLTEMADSALASKRRVLVIGLYGCDDGAGDYLSEAHALGLTRADIEHALSSFTAHLVLRLKDCAVYQLAHKTRRSVAHGVLGPTNPIPVVMVHERAPRPRAFAGERGFDSCNQAVTTAAFQCSSAWIRRVRIRVCLTCPGSRSQSWNNAGSVACIGVPV